MEGTDAIVFPVQKRQRDCEQQSGNSDKEREVVSCTVSFHICISNYKKCPQLARSEIILSKKSVNTAMM